MVLHRLEDEDATSVPSVILDNDGLDECSNDSESMGDDSVWNQSVNGSRNAEELSDEDNNVSSDGIREAGIDLTCTHISL